MFCSGENFDVTFGLMHTVEKSAEILIKVLSVRADKLQTITADNLRKLADGFKLTLPERFLYDK
jgi:rhamnulose-1-phosphate aldolase